VRREFPFFVVSLVIATRHIEIKSRIGDEPSVQNTVNGDSFYNGYGDVGNNERRKHTGRP
jgi:hypothetical protein